MNAQPNRIEVSGKFPVCPHHDEQHDMPGEGIPVEKMPGHWLLARMGKRVLRPGGLETTRAMLSNLHISTNDKVIEFAPGMGLTARMTTKIGPVSYIAVERDENAANLLKKYLEPLGYRCMVGSAENTGLCKGIASVVYGEAMLTMQPLARKRQIVREAFRLLAPGGRYGIHEMCITVPEKSPVSAEAVAKEITQAIHHGAQPLSVSDWTELLESEGFTVESVYQSPMHLLEPKRILKDEGPLRALKFFLNILLDPQARARVKEMRSIFKRYEKKSRRCGAGLPQTGNMSPRPVGLPVIPVRSCPHGYPSPNACTACLGGGGGTRLRKPSEMTWGECFSIWVWMKQAQARSKLSHGLIYQPLSQRSEPPPFKNAPLFLQMLPSFFARRFSSWLPNLLNRLAIRTSILLRISQFIRLRLGQHPAPAVQAIIVATLGERRHLLIKRLFAKIRRLRSRLFQWKQKVETAILQGVKGLLSKLFR